MEDVETKLPGNPGDGAPGIRPSSVKCDNTLKAFFKEKKGLEKFYPKEKFAQLAANASAMANHLIDKLGCRPETAQQLSLLTLYDLAILIDDSSSMNVEQKGQRIQTVKSILDWICKIYVVARPEGINKVNFLNSKGKNNVKSSKLLKALEWDGLTRIGEELNQKILQRMVMKNKQMSKPLLIIVITDGDIEGEPPKLLEGVIMNCINYLKSEDSTNGEHAVGFQFAQVGDSPEATDLLKRLDHDPNVGAYVDCIPPQFGLENIDSNDERERWTLLTKLLLGGISRVWDKRDTIVSYEQLNTHKLPQSDQYEETGSLDDMSDDEDDDEDDDDEEDNQKQTPVPNKKDPEEDEDEDDSEDDD